jgi:Domain of unknown function (DUF4124)
MSTRGLCTALGLMLGLAITGTAAAANNQAAAYKWVDEQGVTHYGDSIPPQYAERELHLLNKQGVEVGHADAAKTTEQLAAEARIREASLKQQQHDNLLITSYTSVKDIESLRDVRLDQLIGQRTAAEQYVENLHSRLVALQGRAKHFRPYNAQAGARRMPDDLAEDLVHTLNEMRTQSNALTSKNEEVAAVKAQFDTDIERFRELHDGHAKR